MRKRFFIRYLLFYGISISIPILILGALSIILTTNYITRQEERNHMNELTYTQQSLDNLFMDARRIDISISTDPVLVMQLKSILYDPANNMSIVSNAALTAFSDLITKKEANNRAISSVYLYFQNKSNRFISSDERIGDIATYYDNAWFEKCGRLRDSTNAWNWMEPRVISRYAYEKKEVVSLYQRTYTGDGILVANISVKYIDELLSNLITQPSQSFFITNGEHRVLFSSDNFAKADREAINLILQSEDDKSNFTVRSKTGFYAVSRLISPSTELQYYTIISSAQLYKLPITIIVIISLLLLVSFMAAMLIAYISAKQNYAYLHNIIDTFDAADKGLPLPAPPAADDVYNYILSNIIHSFLQNNLLKMQLTGKMYQNQVLELLALQSQMNPHFLYNTLDTLYWRVMGLTGNPTPETEMIENISAMLRYTLVNTFHTVTFTQEIENTKNYISIQAVRFQNQFDVVWQVDETVLNSQVVKLLLQPFVENSIIHGLSKYRHLTIKIKAFKVPNSTRLAVIITDNGKGIEKQRLQQIRNRLCAGNEEELHIGLFNTNKRIKLTFGDDSGITVRSRQNFGTSIRISMPLLTEPVSYNDQGINKNKP
jgi:two-component system sensor histidine kinase YesM